MRHSVHSAFYTHSIILLFLLCVLAGCNLSRSQNPPQNPSTEDTIPTMLALTNAARAVPRTCGNRRYAAAPPLQWNAILATAAQSHSQDMATRNFFGHNSPEGQGPAERITAAGYTWSTYGENISAGRSSYAATLASWLQSEGHCRNIMRPDLKDFAVAKASSSTSRYGVYWTQVFATPR